MASRIVSAITKGGEPALDLPAIWFIGQGRKLCHTGDTTHDYSAGMVGYNSPAQFSREYKRHFDFPPSAT